MKRGRRLLFRVLVPLIILVVGAELALQLAGLLAPARVGPAPDDPDAPVIVCLGDSHTYGAGVSEQDAYPARLEKILRDRGHRVNVINLGAPGRNTSEIRRTLPQVLNRYHPEAVIILAGVNNGWNSRDATWSDMADGQPVSLAGRAREILLTRVKILKALSVLAHRLDWSRAEEETSTDRTGALVLHQKREASGESPEKILDRSRRDLVAIVSMVRSKGATPILMTYVSDPEFTFETPNALLRLVAKKMNVPLADNDLALRPALSLRDGSVNRKARDLLFLPDMHPRGPGYQLIALNLARVLEESGALAANSSQPGK